DRQVLGDIDELATAVITATGISLRVFVDEGRTESRKHRRTRVVLRGDKPDLTALPLKLIADGLGDLGIGPRQCFPVRCVLGHYSSPRSICSSCIRRSLCRPPSNSVASQIPRISRASSGATTRAPRLSTFESLCSLAKRAVYRSLQRAALTPLTL